ncbi:tetratricopeptide repeat protein [Mesorhizobium sp. LHD-90]|uniref:tetratricopeptide repeat protein n=1 Tax=Mesorhizobium sp. LHD-90 TaxID=3071414 RepID=UPI0027DF4F6B|nr:tetratricopeptide repeat protein [Mesorhizobium sp. LHD-90]MDQ6432587.1 tetratricopeptide repeat protein [Mesorhizobium sp. LHD-90]
MASSLGSKVKTARSSPSEFEGEAFKVIPHPGSEQLVIFPTGTGAGRTGGFDFWASGNELPVNRIFINSGSRIEWYQGGIPGLGDDLAGVLRTLSDWARYLGTKEILAIGQSMGAAGAILYGTQLGARVLACSPETTIKLPGSRSEKLMHPTAPVRFPDLHDFIRQAKKPVTVFAGERDPIDLYCMSLAKNLPNYHGRTMRRVIHGVPNYLKNRGRLRSFLETFIAGEQIPPMQEDGNALDHPDFARDYYALHVASFREDWDSAIDIGRKLVSNNAWSDHAHYLLGRAYLKTGNYDEALRMFAVASAILPSEGEYRFYVGHCFRHLGDNDLAISTHRRSIRDGVGTAKTHFDLCIIYSKAGLYKRALTEISKAVKLAPDNEAFRARETRVRAQIKSSGLPDNPEAARLRLVYG